MTVEEWLGPNNQLGVDIFNKKYRYNNESFDEWLNRVSGNNSEIQQEVKQLILDKKFIFGGRILANRGLPQLGIKSTYSNCYVLSVQDSIESIYDCCAKIARTYSYGGGCGVDLSNLRPRGAKVNNSAKETTGAVSFMKTFDVVTETIGQNGRRGALLLSLDINHPDIEEFINIKANTDKITNANISVRMNEEFMKAVENNEDYILRYPCNEIGTFNIEVDAPYGQLIETKSVNNTTIYYKRIKAKELYNQIAKNNWNYGEPGILNWQKIKEWNLQSNNPDFEYAGTNPCSEVPLPEGGACLLGSMNLGTYVRDEKFKYNEFFDDVQIATIALNEVLLEGQDFHPLQIQRDCCKQWRQIGLGFMGYADMLIKLNLKYGSKEALEITRNVLWYFTSAAYNASCILNAHSKSPKEWTNLNLSDYYQNLFDFNNNLLVTTDEHPFNSQLFAIAPTGTLSSLWNCSGGAEPLFALEYNRTTKSLHGKDVTYKVYPKVVEDYMKDNNINNAKDLPEWFVSAEDISIEDRIETQAVIQHYIDGSISSTINLKESATIEDVANLYKLAMKKGLKGVTTFRANCARTAILSSTNNTTKNSKEEFPTTTAPKRPKYLEADAYKIRANGEWFIVFVGLMDNRPYEVFALPLNDYVNIPDKMRGTITKIKKKQYSFVPYKDQDKAIRFDNIALDSDEFPEWRNTTLHVSAMLRHGMPITSIMKIEDKCNNIITSFNKAIWKVLSKYAPKETISEKCPECGGEVIRESGCQRCVSCGWSKCLSMLSKNVIYYNDYED